MTDLSRFAAVDFETAPAEGFEQYEGAALDQNRNRITLMAVYNPAGSWVTGPGEHQVPLSGCIFHNGKFDMKMALTHKIGLNLNQWVHDTNLMALAHTDRIPDEWLEEYDAKRKELNKLLGREVHRPARKYSLKTLAPYFLGAQAFWEVADHNNKEYALTDAKLTYELAEYFWPKLVESGTAEFYQKRLLPWAKMLMQAELNGIRVDFDKMAIKEKETQAALEEAEKELKSQWAPAYEAYRLLQLNEIEATYEAKKLLALSKSKPVVLKTKPEEAAARTAAKLAAVAERYDEMKAAAAAKIEPLSLSSPTQLKWLLKDYLGLEVENFQGEESTGKEVLQELADSGRKDVGVLIKHRKASKLITSFFPTYREMQFNGKLHATFHPDVTKTGRLSSSNPNLQQVSRELMCLLSADPGHSLVYRDISAVEPRLVAYVTECPEMCRIFVNGLDWHSFNVRQAMGIEEDDQTIKVRYKNERDLAKECFLSLLYGASWRRIQASAGKRGFTWNDKKCKEIYTKFKYAHREVWEYKEQLEGLYREQGYALNVLGRVCRPADMNNLHMVSLNMVIQSAGSDFLLESTRRTIEAAAAEGIEAQPKLFIHDSATLQTKTEHAKRLFDLFGEQIASWQLTTPHGNIKLLSEGYVGEHL